MAYYHTRYQRHGSQQPQGYCEQSHSLRPQGGSEEGPEWCVHLRVKLKDIWLRIAAVMNYTEMEAKVREATNNEPYDEN